MSAAEKIEIKRLGILAGSGVMPIQLARECTQNGLEVFIIGFEGQTSEELKQYKHFWTGLGAAGAIMRTLKQNSVSDLVFAGAIRRPWLSELKPDLKGMEIIARIGLNAFGDNSLLTMLRLELEKEGFTLHGAQKFSNNMLAQQGNLATRVPNDAEVKSISKGIEASQKLGSLDIGQAVVVQDGVILGVEGVEGTDALVERCSKLQKKGKGAILVKTCKPQQDRDLDLPTIGPETVKKAGEAGFSGVIVQAQAAFILEPQTVAEIANRYNMFVSGVVIDIEPGEH